MEFIFSTHLQFLLEDEVFEVGDDSSGVSGQIVDDVLWLKFFWLGFIAWSLSEDLHKEVAILIQMYHRPFQFDISVHLYTLRKTWQPKTKEPQRRFLFLIYLFLYIVHWASLTKWHGPYSYYYNVTIITIHGKRMDLKMAATLSCGLRQVHNTAEDKCEFHREFPLPQPHPTPAYYPDSLFLVPLQHPIHVFPH